MSRGTCVRTVFEIVDCCLQTLGLDDLPRHWSIEDNTESFVLTALWTPSKETDYEVSDTQGVAAEAARKTTIASLSGLYNVLIQTFEILEYHENPYCWSFRGLPDRFTLKSVWTKTAQSLPGCGTCKGSSSSYALFKILGFSISVIGSCIQKFWLLEERDLNLRLTAAWHVSQQPECDSVRTDASLSDKLNDIYNVLKHSISVLCLNESPDIWKVEVKGYCLRFTMLWDHVSGRESRDTQKDSENSHTVGSDLNSSYEVVGSKDDLSSTDIEDFPCRSNNTLTLTNTRYGSDERLHSDVNSFLSDNILLNSPKHGVVSCEVSSCDSVVGSYSTRCEEDDLLVNRQNLSGVEHQTGSDDTRYAMGGSSPSELADSQSDEQTIRKTDILSWLGLISDPSLRESFLFQLPLNRDGTHNVLDKAEYQDAENSDCTDNFMKFSCESGFESEEVLHSEVGHLNRRQMNIPAIFVVDLSDESQQDTVVVSIIDHHKYAGKGDKIDPCDVSVDAKLSKECKIQALNDSSFARTDDSIQPDQAEDVHYVQDVGYSENSCREPLIGGIRGTGDRGEAHIRNEDFHVSADDSQVNTSYTVTSNTVSHGIDAPIRDSAVDSTSYGLCEVQINSSSTADSETQSLAYEIVEFEWPFNRACSQLPVITVGSAEKNSQQSLVSNLEAQKDSTVLVESAGLEDQTYSISGFRTEEGKGVQKDQDDLHPENTDGVPSVDNGASVLQVAKLRFTDSDTDTVLIHFADSASGLDSMSYGSCDARSRLLQDEIKEISLNGKVLGTASDGFPLPEGRHERDVTMSYQGIEGSDDTYSVRGSVASQGLISKRHGKEGSADLGSQEIEGIEAHSLLSGGNFGNHSSTTSIVGRVSDIPSVLLLQNENASISSLSQGQDYSDDDSLLEFEMKERDSRTNRKPSSSDFSDVVPPSLVQLLFKDKQTELNVSPQIGASIASETDIVLHGHISQDNTVFGVSTENREALGDESTGYFTPSEKELTTEELKFICSSGNLDQKKENTGQRTTGVIEPDEQVHDSPPILFCYPHPSSETLNTVMNIFDERVGSQVEIGNDTFKVVEVHESSVFFPSLLTELTDLGKGVTLLKSEKAAVKDGQDKWESLCFYKTVTSYKPDDSLPDGAADIMVTTCVRRQLEVGQELIKVLPKVTKPLTQGTPVVLVTDMSHCTGTSSEIVFSMQGKPRHFSNVNSTANTVKINEVEEVRDEVDGNDSDTKVSNCPPEPTPMSRTRKKSLSKESESVFRSLFPRVECKRFSIYFPPNTIQSLLPTMQSQIAISKYRSPSIATPGQLPFNDVEINSNLISRGAPSIRANMFVLQTNQVDTDFVGVETNPYVEPAGADGCSFCFECDSWNCSPTTPASQDTFLKPVARKDAPTSEDSYSLSGSSESSSLTFVWDVNSQRIVPARRVYGGSRIPRYRPLSQKKKLRLFSKYFDPNLSLFEPPFLGDCVGRGELHSSLSYMPSARILKRLHSDSDVRYNASLGWSTESRYRTYRRNSYDREKMRQMVALYSYYLSEFNLYKEAIQSEGGQNLKERKANLKEKSYKATAVNRTGKSTQQDEDEESNSPRSCCSSTSESSLASDHTHVVTDDDGTEYVSLRSFFSSHQDNIASNIESLLSGDLSVDDLVRLDGGESDTTDYFIAESLFVPKIYITAAVDSSEDLGSFEEEACHEQSAAREVLSMKQGILFSTECPPLDVEKSDVDKQWSNSSTRRLKEDKSIVRRKVFTFNRGGYDYGISIVWRVNDVLEHARDIYQLMHYLTGDYVDRIWPPTKSSVICISERHWKRAQRRSQHTTNVRTLMSSNY